MQNQFDPELLIYYERLKEKLKNEHIGYLKNHPEIRHILSDFMTKLLLHKPEDVFEFSTEYFKLFEKKSIQTDILPLVFVAPIKSFKKKLIDQLLSDYPHYF